jgi:type II secretory pathway component PulF
MHPDHLDQERNVNRLVEEGLGVYETFVQMGCFDSVFLDSLRAGEEAGMIAESMAHLSRTYQERALVAIAALSIAASWAVWILVAGFIIFFIFRIFGTYVNAISGA